MRIVARLPRHSDGAEFLVARTRLGYRASRLRRLGSTLQAGDLLTASTMRGIELRLAQS